MPDNIQLLIIIITIMYCLVYRTNEGKPWVLPVVSSTEAALVADKTLNHEYLSIDGMKEFYTAASKLILGADSPAIVDNRVSYII